MSGCVHVSHAVANNIIIIIMGGGGGLPAAIDAQRLYKQQHCPGGESRARVAKNVISPAGPPWRHLAGVAPDWRLIGSGGAALVCLFVGAESIRIGFTCRPSDLSAAAAAAVNYNPD